MVQLSFQSFFISYKKVLGPESISGSFFISLLKGVWKMNDQLYMKHALYLAEKGRGWTNPNPLVGAVLVKKNEIIGEGYHQKTGEDHAEIRALKHCIKSPRGATLYVTLEPCCHYGKTPPCTKAIIESGVSKVVVGALDPNPSVAGKGIEELRENNIEVVTGVQSKESEELNTIFNHFIQTKTPYVLMKYGMTLDGKISTYIGESKWITNEKSRRNVHETRHQYMGILVGIQTVLKDDPLLTSRIEEANQPIRIICDSRLKIPLESTVVQTASEVPTIIATLDASTTKAHVLKERGTKVLKVKPYNNHLDLRDLMRRLGELKMDSVLIEGGSSLHWSALNAGIVNRVHAYVSPRLFGGKKANTPVSGQGVETPQDGFHIQVMKMQTFEDDLLIDGKVENYVYRNY